MGTRRQALQRRAWRALEKTLRAFHLQACFALRRGSTTTAAGRRSGAFPKVRKCTAISSLRGRNIVVESELDFKMCGFAKIIDTSGKTRPDELCVTVREMAETVRHRGPDDAGAWVDETSAVALGFRRLAILDLSETGHQPMVSRNGQLVLVFNGEIYNHRDLRSEVTTAGRDVEWAGHSDTETLLACFAAWGVTKTLERTVGMFALALWDRSERRMHLGARSVWRETAVLRLDTTRFCVWLRAQGPQTTSWVRQSDRL